MILFCFVLLFHDFSKCQTIFSQRTVDDIGNPLIDLDKCGRKGMRSHVCDPDGLITVEQAFQLDDQIRAIYNETPCHCSLSVCGKSGGWGGYMVGLAMIKKMKLQIGTEMLAFRSDSNDLYDNAVLSEARYFSGALLSTWNMGRCNEDLLIFYSMEDNMLYVSTNVKTRTLMSDEFVRDVSRDVAFKLELRDKESIAEGFKTMLSLFKSALQGNKPTTTPLRLGASQVFYDHDNSFYGNYYQGNAQQLEGRSSNSATANVKSGLVVGCSLFAYLLLVLSMY